ncbi:hypothetical protein PG993_009253 [Apiospora rasikravindrae]|uniref:Uncharacterized protein n=1 Tax=Apiospora rasikravindrae TaxID=990691 RepID=A0ABR1SIV3_9PEZI
MIRPQPQEVELLVLGAGWTSTFLLPILEKQGIQYAATTTDGRDGTIPFRFDPDSDDEGQFKRLPSATTVLITFPLKNKGPARRLTELYANTHPSTSSSSDGKTKKKPHFIQLGVTSIWKGSDGWQDESSPYDKTDVRGIAEDELMDVADGAVLDLSGLYGGSRQPRHWVDRVVSTKEDLRAKGAVHLIHGQDVARAIVALHRHFTPGKRWIICDMHIYDWWDLIEDWAITALAAAEADSASVSEAEVAKQNRLLTWVGELMQEEDVKALPRDSARLGRVLDGRAFWREMGIMPICGRVR